MRVPPCRSTKGLPSPASSMCMSKPLVATERSRIRISSCFRQISYGPELPMGMGDPRAERLNADCLVPGHAVDRQGICKKQRMWVAPAVAAARQSRHRVKSALRRLRTSNQRGHVGTAELRIGQLSMLETGYDADSRCQPLSDSQMVVRACRSVAASSPGSRPGPVGWPAASLDPGCGRNR